MSQNTFNFLLDYFWEWGFQTFFKRLVIQKTQKQLFKTPKQKTKPLKFPQNKTKKSQHKNLTCTL